MVLGLLRVLRVLSLFNFVGSVVNISIFIRGNRGIEMLSSLFRIVWLIRRIENSVVIVILNFFFYDIVKIGY